jgi:hypothetical protein
VVDSSKNYCAHTIQYYLFHGFNTWFNVARCDLMRCSTSIKMLTNSKIADIILEQERRRTRGIKMTTKSEISNPMAAYSAVPSSERTVTYEDFELTATLIDADSLYLDKPVKAIDNRYASLANLRKKLTWTDNFFEDEDAVIAVFDFDYDAMESFYTSVGWATLASSIIYAPVFVVSLLGLAPCYLRKNIRWTTRSQHVAITHDGIRFVRERRPCCWGLPCTDQGKSSKTGMILAAQ